MSATTLFRLSRDARLFEVRYFGELDYAERARAVDATEQRLKDCWIKQVLVDFTGAWSKPGEDPAQIELFRKAFERATFPRGARIALLNPPDDFDEPTLALARALSFHCRKFRDRTHALAWLRGQL
jgi:hypothetical protein